MRTTALVSYHTRSKIRPTALVSNPSYGKVILDVAQAMGPLFMLDQILGGSFQFGAISIKVTRTGDIPNLAK